LNSKDGNKDNKDALETMRPDLDDVIKNELKKIE